MLVRCSFWRVVLLFDKSPVAVTAGFQRLSESTESLVIIVFLLLFFLAKRPPSGGRAKLHSEEQKENKCLILYLLVFIRPDVGFFCREQLRKVNSQPLRSHLTSRGRDRGQVGSVGLMPGEGAAEEAVLKVETNTLPGVLLTRERN